MKVAELYQGYSGELFEILSFSDNAACIISANTGVYSAVAKPLIDNYTIDWRFKYDFITQEKAINVTKELRQMYFNFEDKNRVMSISQDIDSCIARNADGYHYDLDSAYDELIENNTAFDIACTMALVVKQHNQVGRDMRYHSDVVEWANDFLQNNDIDFEQFKILPLCRSHAIVLNGFAEMVKERSENNGLSMTINSGMSL